VATLIAVPAFDPFLAACWRDVVQRSDALPQLERHVLLHAGPPFDGMPPAPVLNAAVQAALFEGLAADAATARAMLSSGELRLLPAQDYGMVTPLAQVVSASMPLAVVGDSGTEAWAPLVEGPPPGLRFGSLAPEALARLRAMRELGLKRLKSLLRAQPVRLAPVVAQALASGDECHARTGVANQALVAALHGLSPDDHAALSASPGFALTILMAAACWRLRGQPEGIAAVGGNGLRFGLRLHGDRHWRSCPANAPQGTRLQGNDATLALGAIGDSAVLDFCGLGGQSLTAAPTLCEEWRQALPPDLLQRHAATVDPVTGLVDFARVHASGQMPLVNLAILGRDGNTGLIGRGCYMPDPALFEAGMP